MSSNYTQALLSRQVPYGDSKGNINQIEVINCTTKNMDFQDLDYYKNLLSYMSRSLPHIDIKGWGIDSSVVLQLPKSGSTLSAAGTGKIPLYEVGCDQELHLNKDSREAIHINQQHHFLSDDSSVIVGKAMTEDSPFVADKGYQYPRLIVLSRKLTAYEDVISSGDVVSKYRVVSTDSINNDSADTFLECLSSHAYISGLYIAPDAQNSGLWPYDCNSGLS